MSSLPKLALIVAVFTLFFGISVSSAYAQSCAYVPEGKAAPDGYNECVDYRIPYRVPDTSCKPDDRPEGVVKGESYRVCCQSEESVCSVYRLRAPLCGSSDTLFNMECGYNENFLMCWGNNYRPANTRNTSNEWYEGLSGEDYCKTDNDFPPADEFSGKWVGYLTDKAGQITQNPDEAGEFDSVTFNGVEYNDIPNGLVCVCSDPLQGGCQCPGFNNLGGEGESRLWFPHLRLISALSKIAQSLFNPYPNPVKNESPGLNNTTPILENQDFLTTKVTKHQGIDDTTDVVNTTDNNSSLKVGQEAPDSSGLRSFVEEPYNQAQCVVPSKSNRGDDLLGPTVEARMIYTQKYTYPVCPTGNGCVADGQTADSPGACCSNQPNAPEGCSVPPTPTTQRGTVRYICGTLGPRTFPAKGKLAVFIKNPLVEYIYDSMVEGSQSLYKTIMPFFSTKNFDEIPTAVAYSASAVANNQAGQSVEVQAEGSSFPTFYVPHLGSLKKYWLEDVQKALRPKTTGASGPALPVQSTECTAPEPDSLEFQLDILGQGIANGQAAKNVPESVLKSIYSIEALPYYTEKEDYKCTFSSIGIIGLMQIGGDYGYTDTVPADQRPDQEEGMCVQIPGKLNRCWGPDAIEIASRVLLRKIGQWPGGRISTQTEVRRATCGYYGSDNPDDFTKGYANGHFDASQCRGGRCNNMSYADIVCLESGYCDGESWPARLNDICQ